MKPAKITAFLAIKSVSERLENKNFRLFAGRPLYEIMLDKLQRTAAIDRIFIDTDSEIIHETPKYFSKVHVFSRAEHLRGHEVTMNSILEFNLSRMEGKHFLNTHVTNPLLSEETIELAIQRYFAGLVSYDSLCTVLRLQKRAYDHNGEPLNHAFRKMDRTQDLSPVLVENSNLFLFSRTSFFEAGKNRIGLKPQILPMNEIESVDIDNETDFVLAELLHENRSRFSFGDKN